MEVAIASVEHVCDWQVVPLTYLRDGSQHFQQPGTGDDTVLKHVVRLDLAKRTKRALPCLPEAITLVGGARRPDFRGTRGEEQALDVRHEFVNALAHSFNFNEKNRGGVSRKTSVSSPGECLNG